MKTPPAQIKQATIERADNDVRSLQTDSRPRRASASRYLLWAVLLFGLSFGAVALWLVTRDNKPRQETSNASSSVARSPSDDAKANNSSSQGAANQSASRAGSDSSAAASSSPSINSQQDDRAQLRSALDEWVSTTNSGDLSRQMNLYTPVLERFYQRRNVSRSFAREEKERFLANAMSFSVQVSEPELTINADGRTATMLFRKSYSSGGASARSGEVLQELRWVKTTAGWRIASERDVQVIR